MSNDRNNDARSLSLIPAPSMPLADVQQLAKMLAQSKLLPQDLIGKEADIAVTVMAGHELGLAPMAALRGIHVVKGKPVLSADTMVAIALSTGAAEYFKRIESTATSATYETKRRGDDPTRLTFTIQQARDAGLIKSGGNWQMYPEAMLRARAKAALARDVYPDALAGCYEESERDELDAGQGPVQSTGPARPTAGDVIDAHGVERQTSPAAAQAAAQAATSSLDELTVAILADIDRASTVDELRAVAPRVNALPKESPHRAQAKAAYLAGMDALTAPKPKQETSATSDNGAAA